MACIHRYQVYLVRRTGNRYRVACHNIQFLFAITKPSSCQVAVIIETANLIRQKEAWRRWRYHQHYLTVVTSRVRGQVHLAALSSHWHQWITAVNKRTHRGRVLERRVMEMGVRVAAKRFFIAWKTSVRVARTRSLLAEERHQAWQQVNLWLTQL